MKFVDAPQISIIVPVYNVEKYLSDCLTSILSQQDINLEVIVINDGSTDSSLNIAKTFEAQDGRVKLFTYTNQGLSVARNLGIEKANGKYIQFVDSDDYLPADSLKRCLDICEKHDLDACLGSALIKFESEYENVQAYSDKRYIRPTKVSNKVMPGNDVFSSLIQINKYEVSACLYLLKRKSIKELRFKPKILHEDNLFTTQLLLSNDFSRVMIITDPIYIRRFRPNSITSMDKTIKHTNGLNEVYLELLKLYRKDKLLNPQAKKSLKIFNYNLLKTIFWSHGSRGAQLAPARIVGLIKILINLLSPTIMSYELKSRFAIFKQH